MGEASDVELQDAVVGPVTPGADSNIQAAVPSDAGLDQAWQGGLYGGLSTSIGPDDLYALEP
ncbi:MAG: hypothetical protein ABW127_03065 [Candidatus Thiodiazotropha endolucinida]